MGIGAGGEMKQKIYPDSYGIDVWDQNNYGRIAIHIVNSAQFLELTGIQPPPTPVVTKSYTEYGLPWFDLYDETKEDVSPSEHLTAVKTIVEIDVQKGETAVDNESVDVAETQIRKLGTDQSGQRRRPASSPAESGSSSEGERSE
jgi:hypothetical protein